MTSLDQLEVLRLEYVAALGATQQAKDDETWKRLKAISDQKYQAWKAARNA
jgi:hypothetical protein